MVRPLLAGLLGVLLGVSGARADPFTPAQRDEIVGIVRDALKRDPSILRDAVEALQSDESARRQASTRSAIAASHDALVADPADPVSGNPTGDVTVVEFFDTRCPYCRKLEPTMATLLGRDRGVRLVYKDLPILGPASVVGAKALLAAQLQADGGRGGYDKGREGLRGGGADASNEGGLASARGVGLDPERLARDMESASVQGRIAANLQLARALGIQGTPALVIGDTLLPGAIDVAELQEAVRAERGR